MCFKFTVLLTVIAISYMGKQTTNSCYVISQVDFAEPNAYRPYQTVMKPNTNKSFSATGGRPTNKEMPYFNLEGKGDIIGYPQC